MKSDDNLPGKRDASSVADEGDELSRLHQRVSDDELPPQVELAVLDAARRLVHQNAAPANDDDERDPWLTRVHSDFSTDTSPPEVDATVLAAAGKMTQTGRIASGARSAPIPFMRRLRVPLALAAMLVMTVMVLQLAPRAPEQDRIEMLGTSSDHESAQWLTEIRKLIDQGREAEAAQRLGEYRKRYPKLPVPDDIRARLDKAPGR